MKKKVLAMVCAALTIFTTAVSAGSEAKTIEVEESDLNITVNLSDFDEEVFVYNDILYAPLLEAVEAMGGQYAYDTEYDALNINNNYIESFELLAVDGSTLTDEVKYACNTMMSDMVMLLTYAYCLPGFYDIITDIQLTLELSKKGLYQEAAKLFDENVKTIIEIKDYAEDVYLEYADSISEFSFLAFDAYNKLTQAALAKTANALSDVARYANSKQLGIKTNSIEQSFKKTFKSVITIQNTIKCISWRIPVSYLYAYSNNNLEIEELSNLINDTFKKPLAGSDWYAEYVKVDDGVEFPFDDPANIPSIVVYEEDSSSESVVPEKEAEEINVSSVEPTIPISLNNISNIPSQDIIPEGTYKVGYDILPGEYIIICTDDIFSAYVCVKDSNTNKIIENDNFDGCHYISTSLGQYFEISRAIAIPADKYNINVPNYNSIGDGMYKVGTDIPVGEYKLTADTDYLGYYCIYDTADASRKIIANDNFNNTSYVNVKLGQYLQIKRSNAVLVSSPYNY